MSLFHRKKSSLKDKHLTQLEVVKKPVQFNVKEVKKLEKVEKIKRTKK